MKIIFAGTPEFAVPALQALIDLAAIEIVAVLTQPDRPAGRGMQLKASPVKQLALQHHLTVLQPMSLKPAAVQAQMVALAADVLIVAAYGLIIPTDVLNLFAKGSYNIHASLLPRWRGAAPIHRALLAGDAQTGVTIMQVVPKLDAGNMIVKGIVPINEADTTQSLHDALSKMGAHLMAQTLSDLIENGQLPSTSQDEGLVTYAHKLEKYEAAIDWQMSAANISRQVRAFNPFPVATAQFRAQTCRLWFASSLLIASNAQAGQIIALPTATENSLQVACGEHILQVIELQMPGGKRQSALQFVQGQHVQLGEMFG